MVTGKICHFPKRFFKQILFPSLGPRPHRVRGSAAQREKWKILHYLHSTTAAALCVNTLLGSSCFHFLHYITQTLCFFSLCANLDWRMDIPLFEVWENQRHDVVTRCNGEGPPCAVEFSSVSSNHVCLCFQNSKPLFAQKTESSVRRNCSQHSAAAEANNGTAEHFRNARCVLFVCSLVFWHLPQIFFNLFFVLLLKIIEGYKHQLQRRCCSQLSWPSGFCSLHLKEDVWNVHNKYVFMHLVSLASK